MKNLKLILLLVLSPLSFFGQSLSGLWMGSLNNDSTSVRKDQSFEIVLSQYKEKVTGYSRNTFMVNDTLYYIVKRVKGTIVGNVCEVKDDYVVSHNFPKKPEKGVKVTSIFHRSETDSTWNLAGDWKTSKTKKYYAVSGKVDLKEEKDPSVSKLFPHLEELGLDQDVPVFAAVKKSADLTSSKSAPAPAVAKEVAVIKPTTNNEVAKIPVSNKPAATVPVVVRKPESTTATPTTVPPVTTETVKTISKNQEVSPGTAINKPVTTEEKKSTAAINTTSTPEITNETAKHTIEVASVETPKKIEPVEEPTGMEDLGNTIIPKSSAPAPKAVTATTKPVENKPFVQANNKETASVEKPVTVPKPSTISPIAAPTKTLAPAAAFVAQRITEAPQYVNYVSDSLVLILYDNGEIDGDTVSVILNGQMFMEKQGLKASAIRKTVYITPGNEELTLILYAENLGRYPPNTGLLVFYDGEDRHQLRFSADLQKNASVVFRRKK